MRRNQLKAILAFDSLALEAVEIADVGADFEAVALAGGDALAGITGFLLPGPISGEADSLSSVPVSHAVPFRA